MANTKDSQTKAATGSPSEVTGNADTKTETSATITHHFQWYNVQKILFPLLALIALIVSLGVSIQLWQLRNQKNTVDQELDKLKLQQTNIDKQLSSVTQNMEDVVLESQKKFTALNQSLQATQTERLYQKQDWLLLKARHYLELAQIDAHWGDDPKITIALLQQADSVLQDITLQSIFPVRQVIAKEIAQLQALPTVDIPGILSQLDAAQTVVSKLPVIDESSLQTNPETAQKSDVAPVSSLQNHWQQSMSFLEKLIVIRHYDNDIEPALSPMHKALLRESIRMNLQEAQWAVLRNNSILYKQSLDQAVQNIKRAFANSTQTTQALIKQLQTLQQTTLHVAKPAIDQSLQSLNQVINSNANLHVPPATPAGDKTP